MFGNNLKLRYLQYLNHHKTNTGFTLVELVIVFMVIGILSAIALPSFLNQSAKAKQTEAKSYVGAVNRAQQSYRMENNEFAGSLTDLQIGVPLGTVNYNYILNGADPDQATIMAIPTDGKTQRGYSGAVFVDVVGLTRAVSCQTKEVNSVTPVQLPDSSTFTCNGNMEGME
jgi:type IV pilus assembly protein PilA